MRASASSSRCRWHLRASLLLVPIVCDVARAGALPFDPVPSAFQRWLNARRDWPYREQRRFDGLAECSDQTASGSPYRIPVFTCISGSVTIQHPGTAPQLCLIQRVSYFPGNERVRLWSSNCR